MGQLQERYKSYRRPQKYAELGIYPYFRAITSKQGTEVEMDGHHVLMFGSNAYTGLTGDERIIAKAKEALDKYGSGCAGSRFLNGTLDLHEQLEKELAEFVHKDASMCFSTGFSVNQGVIPALLSKDDFVICDDRDHASIVDGRRLSFAKQLHYKHNGLQAVKVTFDSGILFATGSSTLSATAKNSLAKFAEVLKQNTDCDVAVQGYTDNAGWKNSTAEQSVQKNLNLSQQRAQAVTNYLNSLGVSNNQIRSTTGFGEANPVADNSTAAGKAQNRRVEVYMYASQAMIQAAEAGTLQ